MKRYLILLSVSFVATLCGNPDQAVVISGEAALKNMDPKTLEIHTSDRAIINWNSFSIKADEATKFVMPSSTSAVLNRVTGGTTSELMGLLQANGKVYLVNPSGVIIGKDAVINAAGFVASTFDVFDEEFLQNKQLFWKGDSQASIINYGTIEAWDGDILLLGRMITNEGTLEALQGTVGLAVGEEILLKPSEVEHIYIVAKRPSSEEPFEINNLGQIRTLQAELKAEGNPYALAINQAGTIDALALKEEQGRIFLVAEGGTVQVSGSLVANNEEGMGGEIRVLGERVGLVDHACVDVSGSQGGGTILIGGDFQGNNPEILNSKLTVIEKNVLLDASAKDSGDGGKIINWSDGGTFFVGKANARGGSQEGNGGLIEVSGKEHLAFHGLCDTSAPNGNTGTLLLDPTDVTILNNGGTDVNATFANGTYTYSAATATVDNGNLVTNLLFSNVAVTTNSPFNGTGNITVTDPIVVASANALSLIANADITVNEIVSNIMSGNITLSAGGSILVQPADNLIGTLLIGTASGVTTLNSANDLTIVADGQHFCGLLSTAGTINLNIGGDCSLFSAGSFGGTTAGDAVAFIDTPAGTHQLNIGGDLNLNGGTGVGAEVFVGSFGQQAQTDLLINVGGNVNILGGTAEETYAFIGFERGLLPPPIPVAQGSIQMNVGGNILLLSGSDLFAFTQIGFFGSLPSGANFVGIGSIAINALGSVILDAGTGQGTAAIIGFGNDFSQAGDVYSGPVVVQAGQVILNASNSPDGSAIIGFQGSVGATTQLSSTGVQVSSTGLIQLNAGAGTDAAIGYYNHVPAVTANVSIDNVSVSSQNEIVLNAGSLGGAAAIGTFGISGTFASNVNVAASGDVVLNGPAPGQTGRAVILNNQSVPEISAPFDVIVQASNILVGPVGNISGDAEIYSSRNLTMIANQDIELFPVSLIHNGNGAVTLVTDNDFPSPPHQGTGGLTLLAGAVLRSNGPMRLFTSDPQFNNIQAPINGVFFVPGPRYVNSATEKWGTYFPSSFGGFPFTFFYKSAIPAFQNAYGDAISEALRNLSTYDDFLYAKIAFVLGYDRRSYRLECYPKEQLSSYDLISDQTYNTLRQKYRNYNTKYAKSL